MHGPSYRANALLESWTVGTLWIEAVQLFGLFINVFVRAQKFLVYGLCLWLLSCSTGQLAFLLACLLACALFKVIVDRVGTVMWHSVLERVRLQCAGRA